MSSEHPPTSDPGVPAEPLPTFYPVQPAGTAGLPTSNGADGQRNGYGSYAAPADAPHDPSDQPTVPFDVVDPATRRLSPDHPGFPITDAADAEPAPVKRGGSAGTLIREVLETVVLAVLIFLAVRAVVQNFKVEGSSMVSSFLDGEYMLVNKAVYSRIDLRTVHRFLPFVDAGQNPERYIFHGPQHGDVIVFHPPPEAGGDKKDFIKRVIGVPGDTIDFRDQHVLVNGQTLVEPYITAPTTCQGGQWCHVTLGPNQFYAMGDNRTNSSDSRFWGPVSADKIIGKALLIYWCGGSQCKKGTDHIGLAPNHSPSVAPAAAKTTP